MPLSFLRRWRGPAPIVEPAGVLPDIGIPSVDHTADWAQAQVLPWAAAVNLSAAEYAARLDDVNARRHNVIVYDIADGAVNVREKHVHHPLEFNRRIEQARVSLYRDLLLEASAQAGLTAPLSIAVGVGDFVTEVPPDLPLFGLQKRRGDLPMLLPDVEFVENSYYTREHSDLFTDEAKVNQVVFSGASTGRVLAPDDVAHDRGERLRYAAHFVGSPFVKFTIGLAAECTSPEAVQALEAKPYFSNVNWHEQLRSRYIFSMDGNGATCSRVIRTLRSRSVLLKLKSENELFYFSGLIPWRHYIPVDRLEELETLAPRLTRTDFPSGDIADAANVFCAVNLTRARVIAYTGELIGRFAREVHARLRP